MFDDHYPNSQEANHLVSVFSTLFDFTTFSVNAKSESIYQRHIMTYTAKSSDQWELIIEFRNEFTEKEEKQYAANIKFRKDDNRVSYSDGTLVIEKREMNKKLIDFMTKAYNPNFDAMISVLKIFVKQGINSGLFGSIAEKKYKPELKSHFKINYYSGLIYLTDSNFGTITFNRLLQKGHVGYKGIHFKKSYISVGIEYLVNSDDTIHPYFTIRLPYSASRKGTCVIPFNGEQKIYFMPNDDSFRKTCIDKLYSLSTDEKTLKEFFDKEFDNEIKNAISNTLKIRKSELDGLTSDELKEYFILVEMIKI